MKMILGVDYRIRNEFRENDFRKIQPDIDREENRSEPIQGYLEFYKKNIPLLDNKPVSFRAGRMAFELLDRRLIALNEWRNTTNTFQGTRLILGESKEGKTTITRNGRRFQTYGIRFFGQVSKRGWDYDLSRTEQRGMSDIGKGIELKASASTIDIGYSWNIPKYKPRLGGLYGVATGNKQPDSGEQNRFERLYGFARPWSMSDYITFENIRVAKAVATRTPTSIISNYLLLYSSNIYSY